MCQGSFWFYIYAGVCNTSQKSASRIENWQKTLLWNHYQHMDKNNLNHKKLHETKRQKPQLYSIDKSWRFRFASTTCTVNIKHDPLREFLTSTVLSCKNKTQCWIENWPKVTLKSSANGLKIALNRKKYVHTTCKNKQPIGRSWWFRVACTLRELPLLVSIKPFVQLI